MSEVTYNLLSRCPIMRLTCANLRVFLCTPISTEVGKSLVQDGTRVMLRTTRDRVSSLNSSHDQFSRSISARSEYNIGTVTLYFLAGGNESPNAFCGSDGPAVHGRAVSSRSTSSSLRFTSF